MYSGSHAGPADRVFESPEQGSKRFNSITNTIHFAHLGILFVRCTVPGEHLVRCNPLVVPGVVVQLVQELEHLSHCHRNSKREGKHLFRLKIIHKIMEIF